MGTEEQRMFRALERVPTEGNREPWIEQLRALFATAPASRSTRRSRAT